ncbi:MAG: hypothetical protein ACQCXQ_10380, partial [Verrucomicrobiales bacterium]
LSRLSRFTVGTCSTRPTTRASYCLSKHGLTARDKLTLEQSEAVPVIRNAAMFLHGHGPQGDVIRIFNYVRLVRDK